MMQSKYLSFWAHFSRIVFIYLDALQLLYLKNDILSVFECLICFLSDKEAFFVVKFIITNVL